MLSVPKERDSQTRTLLTLIFATSIWEQWTFAELRLTAHCSMAQLSRPAPSSISQLIQSVMGRAPTQTAGPQQGERHHCGDERGSYKTSTSKGESQCDVTASAVSPRQSADAPQHRKRGTKGQSLVFASNRAPSRT